MDPIISVRGLVNELGGHRIHDGLDLEVRQGEVLAILGGSGSGKTVLMRSILGLQQPVAGEVTVMGRHIGEGGELPYGEIGVLFQRGALLSDLTVLENVALPIALHSDLPRVTRVELARLKLALVGLPASAGDKFPAELSGGMVKRAALARAMALDPQVLFLDEPTAGLDPIAASEFDELVLQLHDTLHLTVVMITHDLDTLYRVVKRVAVLVDGRAVTAGLEEIERFDHPWIRRYFGDQRAAAARHLKTGP